MNRLRGNIRIGNAPTLRRMLVFCALAIVLSAYTFPASAVGIAGKVTFTGYSDKAIIIYDINDGSLKVTWGKATNASMYHVKAILLNEVPSDDAYQGIRAVATLVDRDQTAFERSVSFTQSKMRTGGAKYLKIAVGAYAIGETSAEANWNWIGFRLTESVSASAPVFTNGSKNSVYDYNVSNGMLTVSWSAKNATHYRVKAILLNEKPDFDNSGQTPISGGNLYGRGLSKGEEWTKTSLTFSVSDMSRAPYLKVAVGAMSDDEEENDAHWSVIGFHLIAQNADPYPPPSSGSILDVAKSQIGYTGSATSDNTTGANVTNPGDYTKYGIYTGTNGQDWCASFVSWCGYQAGESTIKKAALAGPDSLCTNARTKGGVVYFNAMNDAQRKNHAYLETYAILASRGEVTPSAGDLIFFRWSSAGSSIMFSHVGIVSKVSGGTVYYIDGNGSGDVVKERSKSITSTDIAAFCKLHGRYYVNSTPAPTAAPTFTPTQKPTAAPTAVPTTKPTVVPTAKPTDSPVTYTAQLAANATTMQKDGTFTVTLSLNNNPGIGFMVIQSNAAGQGITLEKAEAIGTAAGASVTYGTNVTLSSTVSINGEGGILLLTFKSESKEDATIQFSCSQCFTVDEDIVTVSGTSVEVKANKRIPGDATDDGVLDGRDVLRLMKYFAGQAVTFNESNADVTGDKIVDGRDVLRLMKYFAGQNVILQ